MPVKLTARRVSDDFIAQYSAVGSMTDYGVPRSPRFPVIEDIELVSLEFLGHDMPRDSLPEQIEAVLLELAEGLDWELDE